MDCISLGKLINDNLCETFECSKYRDFLELSTPFMYPDGDLMSLYLIEESKKIIITDGGETNRILFHYDVDIESSKNKTHLLDRILNMHGVKVINGEYCIEILDQKDLMKGILNFSQSMSEIMDLRFTNKPSEKSMIFNIKVKKFYEEKGIQFREREKITGDSGEIYTLDFFARGKLIKTLSSDNIYTANSLVNKSFRMWYDINEVDKNKSSHITLLDDSKDIWKPQWKKILDKFSDVYDFSEYHNVA